MPATIGPEYAQFMVDLAARIKQLREARGWSFRDMTVKHDYAESHWRRYERHGAVNVQSLLRIAKIFEISLCQLLDGLGEFPAKSLDDIRKQQCEIEKTGVSSNGLPAKALVKNPTRNQLTSASSGPRRHKSST